MDKIILRGFAPIYYLLGDGTLELQKGSITIANALFSVQTCSLHVGNQIELRFEL